LRTFWPKGSQRARLARARVQDLDDLDIRLGAMGEL